MEEEKRIEEIRKRMGEILDIEPFEGIENENEHEISYQLDDWAIDEIQELRKELSELKMKVEELEKVKEIEERLEQIKNRKQEIRKRMGEILDIEPFEGIENENEHEISYQLDDWAIDEIQELRKELKELEGEELNLKVTDITKPEEKKPEETKPEIDMDMALLAKLAKASGVNSLDDMRNKVLQEAKKNNLKPQEMLEDMAQDKGIIPLQITNISVNKNGYLLAWGHNRWVNENTTYNLGEKGINLDRKSEAKYREFILEEFPESKKCINKLDIGIINILYRNNRKDLCESYIESVRDGVRKENCIDIEYDISEAKGLSREETVLRRNARNNKRIATITGKSRNPIKRVYDFVRERMANLTVRASRALHPHQWQEDVKQLKEDMRLTLPEGRKEYVEKGNKILNDILNENVYDESFKKEDLSKPKTITYSADVSKKIEEAKDKLNTSQEEIKELSVKDRIKVSVDNRKIAKKISDGEYNNGQPKKENDNEKSK